MNMLKIAKGRYRCQRTFDFGPYGAYEYDYEIRLENEGMRATGVLKAIFVFRRSTVSIPPSPRS